MNVYLPHIIGGFGVLAFVISYLCRTRRGILAFNILARTLFVFQYILIGGYEGAVQNGIGMLCAVLANNKEKDIFKNRLLLWMSFIWILTIGGGIMSWVSFLSLLPIIAMLLQNSSLWMTKPNMIRTLSLAGIPFWIIYNIISGVYTAAVCDTLSAISIITAFVKYNFKGGLKSGNINRIDK